MAYTRVHASGMDAINELNMKTAKASVDIPEGKLVGLDANGKFVLATQTAGSVVRATTVIKEGSEALVGEAGNLNPDRPLRAGRAQDIEFHFILDVDASTFSQAEVIARTPIYLGTNGAWTKVVPTGTGVLKQKVGFVLTRSTIYVDLTQDPQGTIL